jgi:hypothetical protein
VALACCEETEYVDRGTEKFYRFFICAYKEGKGAFQKEIGVWKSTYYDNYEINVREDDVDLPKQILLSDVDNDKIDEILVITGHWLVIYEYNPSAPIKFDNAQGAFNRVVAFRHQIGGKQLRFNSIAVKDIDGSPDMEIIVSANAEKIVPLKYGFTSIELEDKGYVLFLKLEGTKISLRQTLYLETYLVNKSLCAGDIDNDNQLEICSAGYVGEGESYQGFLYIWDRKKEWGLKKIPIGVTESWPPIICLKIGDLTNRNAGDEIIYGLGNQMLLSIVRWDGNQKLNPISVATLYDYYWVEIDNILIGNFNADDGLEILVSGSGKSGPESGRFYLEVFDNHLNSKWIRIGGSPKELGIQATAFYRR